MLGRASKVTANGVRGLSLRSGLWLCHGNRWLFPTCREWATCVTPGGNIGLRGKEMSELDATPRGCSPRPGVRGALPPRKGPLCKKPVKSQVEEFRWRKRPHSTSQSGGRGRRPLGSVIEGSLEFPFQRGSKGHEARGRVKGTRHEMTSSCSPSDPHRLA